MARILGDDVLTEVSGDRDPVSDGYHSDDDSEDELNDQPAAPVGTRPEFIILPLPSAIGKTRRHELGLASVSDMELSLRRGQANDALEAIRLAIGQKSFLYREGVRPKQRKQMQTRSRTVITSLSEQISRHCKVYSRSRTAMEELGMDALELAAIYRPIAKHDIRTSTTVRKPNEAGHSRDQLSWIWTAATDDSSDSNHLTECQYFCPLSLSILICSQFIASIGSGEGHSVIVGLKKSASQPTK